MAKRVAKSSLIEPKTIGQPIDAEPKHAITRLDQIIGHARAKDTLVSVMQSERVHHAWIFHGPAGVGKLTTAVAFAATLLDPTTSPDLSGVPTPEQGSNVQNLIAAGTHPDFRVITKELAAVSRDDRTRAGKQITLPIEVIREFLIEPAAVSRTLTGASMVGKVFIIDEAELMDQRTQNVLLKTLEEPPAGCVIILITSSEDRLLTTIRSRAQRVSFAPLSEMEMQQWLHASGQEIGEDAKPWVLRFAAGSPGLAALAIEHNLSQWQQQLAPMFDHAAKGLFPAELGTSMAKLVDEQAAEAVKGNPEASKDAANKAWARRMLTFVADDARHRLRMKAAKPGIAAGTLRDDQTVLRALRTLDAVADAELQLGSNVSPGLLFENLAAQMSSDPQNAL